VCAYKARQADSVIWLFVIAAAGCILGSLWQKAGQVPVPSSAMPCMQCIESPQTM